MSKEYSDNIRLNDGAEFTMTVEGDFSKLFEVLGIEVPKKENTLEELKDACETVTDAIKTINRIITETISAQTSDSEAPEKKDQETADLKAACDIVERHNLCYNSPSNVCFCFAKSCKECVYYQDPNIVYKAVVRLLDHAKKTMEDREKVNNRCIRNVSGGVELYDDGNNFIGYVLGFKSEKSEAIIRSIVQDSWGLLTLNPYTLEKIIEDHGYIADMHFLVELYKNPSDIELPEEWRLVKRKTKEEKE